MTAQFDYYEEARKISRALKKDGQNQWADLIIEKIEAGSTATEILMGVRWAVQESLKTRKDKMGEIDKTMLSLVAKIDGALK